MIKLPKLNEDPELQELLCDKFNLQPRGSDGEHFAAKDAEWDLSNKQRSGFSGAELLVQKTVDGDHQLIRVEEFLKNGTKTKEEALKQKETDVTAGTKSKGCCTIA
jgi:hypothetical protein